MLWWIIETTLVAALLAAAAIAVPRLRPIGPAARHALWLVVMVKLMLPPVISWPWEIPTPARPEVASTVRNLPAWTADADALGMARSCAISTFMIARQQLTEYRSEGNLWSRPDASTLGRRGLVGWLAVSAAMAMVQVSRIVAFRRRLCGSSPAPPWLLAEVEHLGRQFGLRTPAVFVLPGLGAPMLWCLGRPKLLLPAHLIKALGGERWRGVLAHELAHIRRGDPWVRRLTLVAGWVWWWNPLYWIARRRLDVEAELACDAWVVWALPGDRMVYAETLLDICASLSTAPATTRDPAPALGVSVSGRSFERRLTMILRDGVPCRLTLPGALARFCWRYWHRPRGLSPGRARTLSFLPAKANRPHT